MAGPARAPAIARRRLRPATAVALAAIALAFLPRLLHLRDADIWWDEGLAVWAARQPLADMAAWTSHDVHPPLYFALLHIWLPAAGDSEFAVRFLSAACGTLTVAALWRLGRLLLPGRPMVAAAATVLLALSRFEVWWSQEARMYALAACLATLHLGCTARLGRRWSPIAAAGYLATAVAALWTLYLLAFLLVIDGLYWLGLLRRLPDWRVRGRALAGWAALQAIALAAFAPWLHYALPRMQSWSEQSPFSPAQFGQLYATLLTLGVSADIERLGPAVLAMAALVALGTLAIARRRDAGAAAGALSLCLLALLLPPLVVWLVTMLPRGVGYTPSPEARYLLPYAPAFALLAAWAVAALARPARRAAPALGALLLSALLVPQLWSLRAYAGDRLLVDDYQSLAATLRAQARPGDAVLLHTDAPWPVFAYYWPRPFTGTPHLQAADAAGADYVLRPLWSAHAGLWLVIDEDAMRDDPRRAYETWLGQHALAQQSWRFGLKRLVLYARTRERAATLAAPAPGFRPPAPSHPLAAAGLALAGWEQPLNRLPAGGIASIAATVRRDGAGGTLEVALGDPPLAQVSQTVPPGNGQLRLPLSVLVPPDAPAGATPWRVTVNGRTAGEGSVELFGGHPAPPAPAVRPQHAVGAAFGSPPRATLLGYDLALPEGAGRALTVTLYWRAGAPSPLSYKVYTHLLDAKGKLVAQRDDLPVHGSRPTTGWSPGEVIVDPYAIAVPPGLPPGRYTLAVGLYDPSTGERLHPVMDAAGAPQPNDELVLTTLRLPATP